MSQFERSQIQPCTNGSLPVLTDGQHSDGLRVLDLFSGIGGFSLGLERTGAFKTVAFCEINSFSRQVLSKHWPDVPIHGDVATYPFTYGEADVITAGFPCQDVSRAGDAKRTAPGLAGERSGLFRYVVRAIRVVRPLYAMLENVAELLGRGMGEVCGSLAEIGHDAEWDCVPTAAVGGKHIRDRLWILAYPAGAGRRQLDLTAVAGHAKTEQHYPHGAHPFGDRWATDEPPVLRRADDVPHRVHRIRALGNTVDPRLPELMGLSVLAASKAQAAA